MSEERRERRGGYGQRRGSYGARRGGYGQRREGYGQRREGYSSGGGFAPKPVEVGKEYDVEIQEVSRRGEGVTRIKGLVCFVPNAKPGEHVKIRINRISRRFAEAEVVGKGEAKAAEEAEETEEGEETKTTEAAESTEESEETEEESEEDE